MELQRVKHDWVTEQQQQQQQDTGQNSTILFLINYFNKFIENLLTY